MSERPELVVIHKPSYQPIADSAHAILQKAHDAIAFIEMETMNLHYSADERLGSKAFDFEKHSYFDELNEEEQAGLYKLRDAAIRENGTLERLWRDLHKTVRTLEGALGTMEKYQ
jgi:hypothetical protein